MDALKSGVIFLPFRSALWRLYILTTRFVRDVVPAPRQQARVFEPDNNRSGIAMAFSSRKRPEQEVRIWITVCNCRY